MKVQDKVIVVTGAGAGIGRALTLGLLARGARVAAADINEAGLRETQALAGEAAERVSTHVLDLSDRAKVAALPAQVIAAQGAVDGVINNAGIIQPFVPFNELDYKDIERVIHVNLYSQIYMIKSFLPELLKRPEAHIVNVSSMGGFFPFPGQTLYGATKAAVKLLSEGLYAELLGSNVGVSVAFPGATATDIGKNSGVEMGGADAESSGLPMASAADAAAEIIAAMEKAKFQAFVGRDSKMMNLFYRLNPRAATRFIQKQMQRMLG
ncbi:MAG: SDR family oxidoreductase [Anaerolineales bacterium]|nr:SDR family oxidoreductase [Anaerolineales bacterium]